MSEFPNIRSAHVTLAALRPGLRLALFFDPLHVQASDMCMHMCMCIMLSVCMDGCK